MIIPDRTTSSLDRLAATATTHCLTGCAIGEVAGMVMVIATALGWGNTASIALAVGLVVNRAPSIRRGRGRAVAHRHHG